ncbi:MAG TPA: hypothetical protein VFA78_06125 [Chloroflexota bacterium]|nr:hypothetical protein [Chloroflexota bacterium]
MKVICALGILTLLVATGFSTTRTQRTSVVISPLTKKSAKYKSGPYTLTLKSKKGEIEILRGKVGLAIRELPGGKNVNLLSSVRSFKHTATAWTLSGATKWARFTVTIGLFSAQPGLFSISTKIKPTKDIPTPNGSADISPVSSKASTLEEYAAAPPIAGSSIYLADHAMGSAILYLSDFTSLGQYFQRTNSGVTQPNFTYPGAGEKGALVGVSGGTFGYVPPPNSLLSLPTGKTTLVVRSYLYLQPTIPSDETAEADTYLTMLDGVYQHLPKPSIPAPNWPAAASKAATELADPSNWVTVGGHQYLVSYVSDTRTSPELITQAGVLAGIEAYEKQSGTTVPIAATLDADLATFYDPVYQTVTNGLPHDPNATGESWYFVDNLISLLQLAQGGDATAKDLLLKSVGSLITLAHDNNYVFPQSFQYGVWKGGQSTPEPDVAGGYAWLMLGLYDLTGDSSYLTEAETSIAHVAGRGFNLSYETHMTAYTAAAAERLYHVTGDATYRGYALLALANLFHATRLWDCTYGACASGSGYHTYMGLNPLPWSDYTAMLEQYEAWLALRDFQTYDAGEPAYVTDLVNAFLTYTPQMMQYALPPNLPKGAASSAAGEYPFVPHNNLSWYLPLEDLREGDATSGTIGQEIYGAGGVFMFASLSGAGP